MSVLSLETIYYRYERFSNMCWMIWNATLKKENSMQSLGNPGRKSTFLSLLAGLDSPTKEGKVCFNGARYCARIIQWTPPRPHLLVFRNYNLIDYCRSIYELVNGKATKNILLKLGLKEKGVIRNNVLKLSGGQQQRVAIARALVSKASG